jgi:hypothetical protein
VGEWGVVGGVFVGSAIVGGVVVGFVVEVGMGYARAS